MSALLLNRRTGYGGVGAIHAAIAFLGLEHLMAVRALIKPLARIRRHGFGLAEAAMRAGDGGVWNNLAHLAAPLTVDG